MKKILFFISLMGIAFNFNACVPGYVDVEPTYSEVTRPNRPSNNHIWRDGDWVYNRGSRAYVYRNGNWVTPNRGRTFVPGHWQSNHRGNYWVSGRWK
jgi:hypothetical protein